MSAPVKCKCCGLTMIAPPAERALSGLCPICDHCDRRHGDALQLAVSRARARNLITWDQALGRMMVDDAWLAGMLTFRLLDDGTYAPWIPMAVPRWRVVVGRAQALGEPPDIALAIAVTVAKYQPGRASYDVLQDIRDDVLAMAQCLDPDVVDVIVRSKNGGIRPDDLNIEVASRKSTIFGVEVSPDAAIPDDILSRPRGQA